MPQREETRVMRRMIGVVAILPLLTTSASADVLCKSKKPVSGRHPRGRRRRGDAARLSSRAPLAGLLLLGAVLQPAPARAFPGGIAASCGACVSSDDVAWALALQGDGKVVAAGERRACVGGEHDGERCQVTDDCSAFPCVADFALARYRADGSVDLTFGSGGRVVTDFGGDDTAFALAVQPDGKIVVAGVSTGGGTMDFALARYDSDGALDTTFGSGGRVVTDLGGQDEAFALLIQPDGRLVAAGASTAAGNLD